jgi:hypothetical protein
MTDEMMHAQMAAAYAAQRTTMKHHQPASLDQLLPPHLWSQFDHFMQARQYTTQQALSVILSKFFGSCSKLPQ